MADKRLIPAGIRGVSTEAFNELIDRIGTLDLTPILVYIIDSVNSSALPHLAEQFHVSGREGWSLVSTEAERRSLIKRAIELHRYKGTPWAVKQMLAVMGFSDTEIIEYHQARNRFVENGGKGLDGVWKLDGSVKLIPYYDIAGLPYMHHWAQFVVRINLANATRIGFDRDIRFAVESAKNVRSWPLYLFWMAMDMQIEPRHYYVLYLDKCVEQQFPWDVNRVDGSWKIGIDDRVARLGELSLDGSWRLPEMIPGIAHRNLYNGIISTEKFLHKTTEMYRDVYVRVGETKARLDGGWAVGKNDITTMSGTSLLKNVESDGRPSWDVTESLAFDLSYPTSPVKLCGIRKLTRHLRLDGSWGLNTSALPLRLGQFGLKREKPVKTDMDITASSTCAMGILKRLNCYRKLGMYRANKRLDSTWSVSAHHKLDGSWIVDGSKQLSAPTIGQVTLKLDGGWGIGPVIDQKLNGAWKIGQGQGAFIDIEIRKAA